MVSAGPSISSPVPTETGVFPAVPPKAGSGWAIWPLGGAVVLLVIAIYFPTLRWTAHILLESDDMAHGLIAPLVAVSIAFRKRREILAPPAAPSFAGLALLTVAGALGVIGSLGGSTTILRCAFFGSLSGTILLLGGLPALSRLKFPLFLLLFAVPIPQLLYAEITSPLQGLATSLSRHALEGLGFSVAQDGYLLELPHFRLSIVEACSGIRSLITLTFFCVLYAYFWEKKTWSRALVVAFSVPAALALNATRITSTAILGETRPFLAQGIYHEMLGWLSLVLAFGLVVLSSQTIFYIASAHGRRRGGGK